MWQAIGITPLQAVEVLVATIGIYFAVLLLIRLLGQRTIAALSNFDFAAILVLGAVAGRAILGYTPTMAAGFVALAAVFALQAVVGRLRRSPRGTKTLSNKAIVLVAGGEPVEANMLRMHITDEELNSTLRGAGVRSMSEVACVIMESTGALSVLRRGELIDFRLLESVRDHELIPDELVNFPAQS